jgi:hypothetical protein
VRKPLRRIHEGILRLLDGTTIQDMLDDSDDGPAPIAPPLVALQLGSAAPILTD